MKFAIGPQYQISFTFVVVFEINNTDEWSDIHNFPHYSLILCTLCKELLILRARFWEIEHDKVFTTYNFPKPICW
jgi:hypothetical protein